GSRARGRRPLRSRAFQSRRSRVGETPAPPHAGSRVVARRAAAFLGPLPPRSNGCSKIEPSFGILARNGHEGQCAARGAVPGRSDPRCYNECTGTTGWFMSRASRALAVLLASSFVSVTSAARVAPRGERATLRSVPGDYPSIAEAINASANGDT